MQDLTIDSAVPGWIRQRDISESVVKHYGNVGDATHGCFVLLSPVDECQMYVIASSEGGWDHVSARRITGKRPPNWPEMCHVKKLFFEPDEVVVQYHPRESEYVNVHPFVLHLWRPQDVELPTPPPEFVG